MCASKERPKVFISYRWSRAEHKQFVMELASPSEHLASMPSSTSGG